MRIITGFLLAFVTWVSVAWAGPVTPLVDVDWIAENGNRADVVILDIRNKLGKASAETYRAGHIPGAVYSDYLKAGWRTTVDGVPGQFPPVADLEALIGDLGIDNSKHVIIVAGGTSALDMGSATRVYFTFKALGHDRVSILDGGYRAYAADPANPVETGSNQPQPAVFEATPRPWMFADRSDVAAARGKGARLVDVRPTPQFRGELKHPAAARPGTIPGARSIPESNLTDTRGRFISAAQARALWRNAGLAAADEQIKFCNTGHWASLGWFVSSEILGNAQTRLYDGSMVDWSADQSLPVEVQAAQ